MSVDYPPKYARVKGALTLIDRIPDFVTDRELEGALRRQNWPSSASGAFSEFLALAYALRAHRGRMRGDYCPFACVLCDALAPDRFNPHVVTRG